MTIGVVNKEGMAFYERRGGRETAVESPEPESDTFELQILSFGRSHSAARQLRQQALDWDDAGRPGEAGLRVRVFPADSDSPDSGHSRETILTGRWHKIVVDWP
jgi:hypothetical protein